ncbi:hypothetical protein AYK24_10795 [Thermoplasmatales archaeon SG8-52-4]|nr:MAG: hypothetical protein AYK24_10795 [Thermoplasmatales archaeon SG8-52-4]
MEMKRKILAILMVLMFFSIPLSFAQASMTGEGQDNDNVAVEIASFNEDNSLVTEIFKLSKEELTEFENILSVLMDNIQSAGNRDDALSILENLIDQKGIIKSIITRLILSLKNLRHRGFVMSFGHGFKFNPFKKNSYKIRQNSKFWIYTNGGKTEDRTIILKPFSIKFDILKGIQIGRMANFFGIYIFIAKKFPQKSTTFFMGTARKINGKQFFSFR